MDLLYDNGSSLCCYLLESNLDSYLGNDKIRFQSLVNTKSRSRIRIDKYNKKEPTHLEVLKYLNGNYYDDVIDTVKTISYNVDESSVDSILETYDGIMSKERKAVIKKFLLEKVNLMETVFNLGKGE